MDKLFFKNIKSFCSSKYTVKKMKGKLQNWREYLQVLSLIKYWVGQKVCLDFFCTMLQKKPNKLYGQLNTYIHDI